jgi:hypothetical protein
MVEDAVSGCITHFASLIKSFAKITPFLFEVLVIFVYLQQDVRLGQII